jgi:hypothetical protein
MLLPLLLLPVTSCIPCRSSARASVALLLAPSGTLAAPVAATAAAALLAMLLLLLAAAEACIAI